MATTPSVARCRRYTCFQAHGNHIANGSEASVDQHTPHSIVKVRGLCIPKKAGEPSADLCLELNARIQEPWVDLTCDLTKAYT
jgi:hypothetical protein